MKKILILPILISCTMICSCQKEDSAGDQLLAQQKAELTAREKALDERLNALDQRLNGLDQKVRTLAAKENTTRSTQTVPPDVQSQDVMRDVEQMKALMADPSRLNSAKTEKERLTQERRAQRQAGLGALESQRPSKPSGSGMAVLPAAENSPTPSSTP
jgi:chromosome segregation ATPase